MHTASLPATVGCTLHPLHQPHSFNSFVRHSNPCIKLCDTVCPILAVTLQKACIWVCLSAAGAFLVPRSQQHCLTRPSIKQGDQKMPVPNRQRNKTTPAGIPKIYQNPRWIAPTVRHMGFKINTHDCPEAEAMQLAETAVDCQASRHQAVVDANLAVLLPPTRCRVLQPADNHKVCPADNRLLLCTGPISYASRPQSLITTGLAGLPPPPTATFCSLSTTSVPSSTRPKTTWRPSSHGVGPVVMKN